MLLPDHCARDVVQRWDVHVQLLYNICKNESTLNPSRFSPQKWAQLSKGRGGALTIDVGICPLIAEC